MSVYTDYVKVTQVAAEQSGVITRAQIMRLGISDGALRTMLTCPDGMYARAQGVYCVPQWLVETDWEVTHSRFQLLAPELFNWEKTDPSVAWKYGVVSHFSAAEMHGCLTLPLETHFTVPTRKRLTDIFIHTAAIMPDEITVIDGLPVTTLERTTRDLGHLRMDGEQRARWMDFLVTDCQWSLDKVFDVIGPRAVSESRRYMYWGAAA